MTLALDIAATRPRAERNGVIRFVVRLFREKPLGAAGGVVFVLFLLCGLFADVLAPYGMNQISPRTRLMAPSWAHWFGTDNLGRDMLSRCLYGAQISVIIAFTTATLATIVSVAVGILTGYLGGKFDLIVQRFVDAWMSFPDLIILLVVVSVLGPGIPQIIFTLGCLLGIAGSRIIRSAVVSVRENMYVHAAQSIGASTGRILLRHILPNIMPPIIVLFTTRVGTVILAEFEPVVPRPRRAAADPDLGRHAVGIGPHLHVPGTVAGACARPVSHRRRLRHQRVRRCLARSARSAHARLAIE